MNTLAVIPARGGSKGIPRKNVRDLCGKPMMAWTIEAAKRSRWIDFVLVSTDDDEAAQVAMEWDVDDVRRTGPNLHHDACTSRWIDVDALEHLHHEHGVDPDALVRLHPTSPLRTHEHIDAAIDEWNKRGAVVGVERAPKHPDKCFRRAADGRLTRWSGPGGGMIPRQDMERAYAVNGALYATRVDYFRDGFSVWGDETYGFVMDEEASWDVDTPFDFRVAEHLLRHRETERKVMRAISDPVAV